VYTHTSMERPFACSECCCNKRYTTKRGLYNHINTVHKRVLRGGRDINYVAREMLASARKRALKSGGAVTITLRWIKGILKLGRCQGSMPPLQFEILQASTPFSPSLDRIDSRNRDYTPENTRIVCWCINAMRQNFSDSVVYNASISLASFIGRRRNSI
jgi:hypothetical protein